MGKRDIGRRETRKPKKLVKQTISIEGLQPTQSAEVEVVKRKKRKEEEGTSEE